MKPSSHDEMSARQVLQKLLSEASFIEMGSRKYARNRLSLVDNQNVEDKFRRAEGKLRRAEKLQKGGTPFQKRLARTR